MQRMTTTIKIENDVYDEFKILGVKNKFTLQDFVDKCVLRYITDDQFRQDIDDYQLPNKKAAKKIRAVQISKKEEMVSKLSTTGPFSIT